MRKKLISLLLALILCFAMAIPAVAASDTAIASAENLHLYGLFKGVGTNVDGSPNYDLDRGLTRAEAVTLLVRLLGREPAATAGKWTTPFNDVPDWAKPYVGYAYENKLTNGVSATSFGSEDFVSATQFLTFALRALGYESGVDFEWDAAWVLSDELKITSGQYGAGTEFLRGDAVVVAYYSLYTKTRGNRVLHDVVFETLAAAANEHNPERFNDYENGKNGITIRHPDKWTLAPSDISKHIYFKNSYYLNDVFSASNDADFAISKNRDTKSSIVVGSSTIPQKYAELLSNDYILEKFEAVAGEDSKVINSTTICGQTYVGLLYTLPDRAYQNYIFASVFNGEVVCINIFCYDVDSIDTILDFFE